MPAYPIIRFVASIAANPTVDLDLNLGQPFTTLDDGFTLGAPAYEGDPLSVGAKWGYRTITLTTLVSGTAASALTAYSALGKQITQDNLLMVQLDAAQPPVFFRTYKTAPSELSFEDARSDVTVSGSYRMSVNLTADHAGYGLPVTVTPTIANDPVAGTNPCFYRFGTILGDLETPLYAEAPASNARGQDRMLSSSALISPATQTAPVFIQNTALTHGGTAAGGTAPVGSLVDFTSDAAMAGGTYTRYTGSASDNGVTTPVCLLNVVNTSPGVLVGDYRVFMRVRRGSTTPWSLSLAQIDQVSAAYATHHGDTVVYDPPASTNGPNWVDMGVFRFPFGGPAVDVFFDTAYASPGLSFAVLLRNNAVASATLDFDGLLFVPAGLDQAISSKYSESTYDKSLTATTYKAVWNGLTDNRYILDTSNNYAAGIAVGTPGELPTVVPGADNSIHYLQHIGPGIKDTVRTGVTSGTNDVLTATTVMTLKYFPRYLWLRPSGG